MGNPGIVIAAILALAAVYVLLPRMAHILGRYWEPRVLACPEAGNTADLSIDAPRAAWTSVFGRPRLRVIRCSLWPARRGCGQACMQQPDVETP